MDGFVHRYLAYFASDLLVIGLLRSSSFEAGNCFVELSYFGKGVCRRPVKGNVLEIALECDLEVLNLLLRNFESVTSFRDFT